MALIIFSSIKSCNRIILPYCICDMFFWRVSLTNIEFDQTTKVCYIWMNRHVDLTSNIKLISTELSTLLEKIIHVCVDVVQMGLRYCRGQHGFPVCQFTDLPAPWHQIPVMICNMYSDCKAADVSHSSGTFWFCYQILTLNTCVTLYFTVNQVSRHWYHNINKQVPI